MQLTKPAIFVENQFGSKKLQYKWYRGINIKFMEIRNKKLYNQVIKMNCKAATALTIAACEWIIWRLADWRQESCDLQKYYLQALWVSLISKEYLSRKKIPSNFGKIHTREGEPIEMVNSNMNKLKLNYIAHHPHIYQNVVNMLELARHVSDDQAFFDPWAKSCLERSIKLFPVPQDNLDKDGVFIYNDTEGFDPYLIKEPFIPREFYFEPDFNYETADLKQLQSKLLSTVDYKENPFLSSPERMLSIDFVGIPYEINE